MRSLSVRALNSGRRLLMSSSLGRSVTWSLATPCPQRRRCLVVGPTSRRPQGTQFLTAGQRSSFNIVEHRLSDPGHTAPETVPEFCIRIWCVTSPPSCRRHEDVGREAAATNAPFKPSQSLKLFFWRGRCSTEKLWELCIWPQADIPV